MDVTIKLEEKNLSVDFDEQYRVEDVSDIGTVKIVMLKGEKGSKGDPGGEWSAYDLAPAIVDIASGNPVHITDGAADYPLTSAVIDIESTQSGSGDPSPSNVRPITGWTGANVYVADEEPVLGEGRNLMIQTVNPTPSARPKLVGQTVNTAAGGSPTVEAVEHGLKLTVQTNNQFGLRFGTTSVESGTLNGLLPGETYTLSCDFECKFASNLTSGTAYLRAYFYDNSANASAFAQNGRADWAEYTASNAGEVQRGHGVFTFTVPTNVTKLYLRIYTTNSTTNASGDYIEYTYLKLEKGDTSTDWCPAPEDLATPATVSFDRAVTGGTLNALTGAMTVTKQMDTYDGSSDETWEKMGNLGSRRYFRGRISGQYYDSGRHGEVDVVANWLPTVSSQQDTSYTLSSVRLTTYTYSSNYLFILLGTDLPAITTVAEWRAYLAEHPLQVSYKIATAASVSVDPMEVKTLGGENYIWANCGEIAVEYKADTTARTSAARILDLIYPIGSVYTSVNDVSPATFIGGTWERFGAGRFLMGVDNGTSETTGGASSVTLQATQIPSHTHTIRVESPNAEAGIAKAIASSAIVSTSTYTTEYLNSFAGATNPSDVSILPPYVTVYFWKRTA